MSKQKKDVISPSEANEILGRQANFVAPASALLNPTRDPVLVSGDVPSADQYRFGAQVAAIFENPMIDASTKEMMKGLAADLSPVRAASSRVYLREEGIEVQIPGDAITKAAHLDVNLSVRLLSWLIGKELTLSVMKTANGDGITQPMVWLTQKVHLELRRTSKLDLTEEKEKYHPDVDDDDANALGQALNKMFARETIGLLRQVAMLNKLSLSATLQILTQRVVEQRKAERAPAKSAEESLFDEIVRG